MKNTIKEKKKKVEQKTQIKKKLARKKNSRMEMTEECIKIYAVYLQYSTALEKKEILSLVSTWMYLEDIMLSKVYHSSKQILHDPLT